MILGAPDGPPDVIRAYSLESPITEEVAERMTDDQWLRAMAKYHPGRPWDFSKRGRGGASHFAGILGTFVAKDPKRFAALAHRIPPAAEPNYLCAVLQNLKNAAIPSPDKIAAARLGFAWPPENAASSTLSLLGAIEDVLIPTDAVDYIRLRAFDGPGPMGKPRRVTSGGREKDVDIRIEGQNTTRGQAIEAIARLLFLDRAYLDVFGPDIEKLTQDPSASIRGCTAHGVYAMASHDPNRALALMPAFFDCGEALHSSEYVCRLIKHGLRQHMEVLRPYVHQLLDSPNPEARRHGGIAACLALLHHRSEGDLAEKAITGSAEARLGSAAVGEGNLLDPNHRAWCEHTLKRLFNDSDNDVREGAAHCFWPLWTSPNHPLTDYADLIEAFLRSAAFTTDPSFLLHALEETRTRLPDQVLHVCEIFVERCAAEARDISTGVAADEHTVATLVFRAFAQMPTVEGRRRAVSVIDRMCEEGLHSAGKHLGEFER